MYRIVGIALIIPRERWGFGTFVPQLLASTWPEKIKISLFDPTTVFDIDENFPTNFLYSSSLGAETDVLPRIKSVP